MRAVIQRVKECRVNIDERETAKIGKGLLVLLAVGRNDADKDVDFMVRKITELRIFNDKQGKMNLSVTDIDGEVMVISNFTLYGDCRKGRRPSYDKASTPEKAEKLYRQVIERLKEQKIKVKTGEFGAMMKVSLINDGPVTLILES